MTVVRRRPKPVLEPGHLWPSLRITPRVTLTGMVPAHAGGVDSALLEEAIGRMVQLNDDPDFERACELQAEVHALAVALSVVTRRTIEDEFERISQAAQAAPAAAASRRSARAGRG